MAGHSYHAAMAEAKRGQIVAAGRSLFLREGYARVAMADIANQAGVSVTTLYRHFESKDELFAAVVDTVLMRFTQTLNGVELPDDEVDSALAAYAKTYVQLLCDGEVVAMARVIIAEASVFAPIAHAFLQALKGSAFHRLESFLEAAMARGLLQRHRPADSMGQFLGYLERSFLLPRLLAPDYPAPQAEHVSEVTRLAIESLLAVHGVQDGELGSRAKRHD